MLVEFIIWNNYEIKELIWDNPTPEEKKEIVEKILNKISPPIIEFTGPDVSSVITEFLF
jgi:hypothetical protein